jgi:hypothetical protein
MNENLNILENKLKYDSIIYNFLNLLNELYYHNKTSYMKFIIEDIKQLMIYYFNKLENNEFN